MKKVVCWVVDHSMLHQCSCLVSMYSFLRYNVGWDLRVYVLGCSQNFLAALPAGCVVVRIPGGERALLRTRCEMLRDVGDSLLLYLDCDTVVMGSLDGVVDRFLSSGRMMGMYPLDGRVFPGGMIGAWEWNWPVLLGEGVRSLPVLSDGMMLGLGCGDVGRWCVDHLGELPGYGRGLIGSACYELGVVVHEFGDLECCVLREEAVLHRGHPYLTPCYLGAERVVVRHFFGWPTKGVLCNYLAYMTDEYVGRYVHCKD